MPPFIKANIGRAGTTVRILSSDTARTLAVAGVTMVTTSDNPAIGVLITCETNSIRLAYNTNPTQGASGIGHVLNAGDSYEIFGGAAHSVRLISAASGVHGVLQITPFF